ncbi:DUF523 and DUF1722 domain-containing protein, partial [uncultured Kiloniella sp.]|uniref:YbgA family protein n=1 Tax=uncultured Kiloniella sp. TaxID=1133091 RepID=UPI00260EFE56
MNTTSIITTDQQTSNTANPTQPNTGEPSHRSDGKINIGLSACLAGQEVRYNGGHSQSRLCLNVLSEHFNYKTFCPEVAAGFSTPRPTMRLTGSPESPTLSFTNDDTQDLTRQLTDGFKDKLNQFEGLDGYILMKNSPSCGMSRIKVYQKNGYPHETRVAGLFTSALQKKYPLMPIEEEGRLHDAKLFENFVLRVYAHHHFRTEVLANPKISNLITFHSRYKYVLMAHSPNAYKKLGRLVGSVKKQSTELLLEEYFKLFMAALSKPASKKNHTNTLLHILGYLRKSIPAKPRQNIADVIIKYNKGIIPLVTP